ncbi:hypothetical protein B0T18DRAFT_414670 [Schizothecium vesticola]|uniref:RNA helicase HEL117 n=1 Tax=Schizothecium vesticola TaxID=314040 RepID=A0AA40EPM9_9PEZI|nr:hypothetical protein B0T18DRAFT_414670 [Schizothecium vesticola]
MPSEPSHPRPRSRSRSPHRTRDDQGTGKTTRSRSPLRGGRHSTRDRHSHSHHHHSKDRRHHHQRRPHDDDKPPRDRDRDRTKATPVLPSNARQLSRGDLAAFEPLFAHYLDLQKGLDIAALDDAELKGRWKSFVSKWNRGELAAGWYEPETFERVRGEYVPAPRAAAAAPAPAPAESEPAVEDDGEDDEDDYGPALPSARGGSGPGIPTLEDLSLRAEQAASDRDAGFADLRAARKEDRKEQKERLEDLVPRAEAGTRERMLEKRREVGDKMRAFRERSPGGGGDEVADDELVGGADGGVAEYKRMMEREKVKVSERQLRREAVAREIAAEREERVKAYREREEETMGKLRELARRRFG